MAVQHHDPRCSHVSSGLKVPAKLAILCVCAGSSNTRFDCMGFSSTTVGVLPYLFAAILGFAEAHAINIGTTAK